VTADRPAGAAVLGERLQAVCENLAGPARRLIAAVADRDPGGVRHALRDVRAAPTPSGVDPLVVLAVVLAELAAPARQAVRVVLHNAPDPDDAGPLLDVLGLTDTARAMIGADQAPAVGGPA
jgi:hypothetical protein